jgi:hypothetical protein
VIDQTSVLDQSDRSWADPLLTSRTGVAGHSDRLTSVSTSTLASAAPAPSSLWHASATTSSSECV